VPDDTFSALCATLREKHDKYEILFLFGVETGLRVSDILRLRIRDIKTNMAVRETKTGKDKRFMLSANLLSRINQYALRTHLHRSDAFIPSSRTNKKTPLSRVQAYRVIKACAEASGVSENVGTHSMRKTYAKRLYATTGSLDAVKEAMGHKYIETTLRYFMDFNNLMPT
jgi:integrase